MIEITPTIKIHESELQFDFVRASGPGGQNVNKVATAVQLRFDISAAKLPGEVKLRLIQHAGRRVTAEGILLLESRRFRTQEQNRDEAIQRLVALIRRSALRPKSRRKTRPTKTSMEARLKEKKRIGKVKKNRRDTNFD